jgi:hypothetical protein
MLFTDQKPHKIDEDMLKTFKRVKNRCACYMCGQDFKVGEVFRWVFTNGTEGASGNPIVCENCDGDDVIERWKAKHSQFKEIKNSFWWFIQAYGDHSKC